MKKLASSEKSVVQSSVEDFHTEEEIRLRAILASSPDAITVADLNGNIIDCNQAALDLFEFSSKEELIGKSGFPFIAEKDHQRAMEDLMKTLEQGSVKNIRYTCLTRDGYEFLAELSASVIKDSSGNPTGFVAITKDITERKQMEEELKKSEMRYRSLVENTATGIITVDPEGKFVFVNEAICKMLGFSEKELLGKHFINFVHPDDKERILQTFWNTLKYPNRKPRFEFRAVHKKGHIIHMFSTPTLFKYKNKIVGSHAIITDITDRKKAEEEISKFKTISDKAGYGSAISDLEGNLIYVNESFAKMHGYAADELVGKNLSIFHTKEQIRNVERLKQQLRQKGNYVTEEVWHKRKDNTVFPTFMNGTLIKDKEGKTLFMAATAADITERKRMEETLRESEEKFRNIFESANDCMISLDSSGRILDVNRKAVELFGGSKEELMGKHFTKLGLFSLKDIPKVMTAFASGLADKDFTLNIRIKNKKNQKIPLECSTSVMRIDGKLAGVMVIARDVTQRERAEERIRESEEEHRNLLENARDTIMAVDLNGNITFVNRVIEEYGFKKDEIIGKNMTEFVPEKYQPELIKDLKKVVRGNPAEGEVEIITPKGKIVSEYRSSPIRRGNKVIGSQTILRDITERKKAEEKIRASEEKYRGIVELAPDSIVTFDMKGIITSCNTAAIRMTGYSKDEIVGKHFSKLGFLRARDIPRYLKLLSHAVRGKVPKSLEVNCIRKDGAPYLAEVCFGLLKEGGKTIGFQVIGRDVIERKRMEDELRRYSEHLEELVEERTRALKASQDRLIKSERLAAIGELATMVAHDLRNPLTSIRTAGYYLRNSCHTCEKPECKTMLEMCDIIEQETLFADNIINDLLDFATKRLPQKKRQNINDLVKASLKTSNIPDNIKVNRTFVKKAIANIDGKQLQRVFLNLIKNAVQAMPNGGKLTVKTSETKDIIEITFTDTGIGIREENMSKIFTPLFTTKAKGIGMGLPICKRIVERHGGTIDVKSKADRGTIFTIKLPKKGEGNNP